MLHSISPEDLHKPVPDLTVMLTTLAFLLVKVASSCISISMFSSYWYAALTLLHSSGSLFLKYLVHKFSQFIVFSISISSIFSFPSLKDMDVESFLFLVFMNSEVKEALSFPKASSFSYPVFFALSKGLPDSLSSLCSFCLSSLFILNKNLLMFSVISFLMFCSGVVK